MSAPARSPRCSIVIPVWNRAELTEQCLDALRLLRCDTPYEVIVVDNGSTDRTAQVLAEREWVREVRNTENRGFAIACNQGARAARGELVLFLNNDTIPRAGWLDALVAALDRDPGAGVAGAKLLYPNGRVQHAGIAISHAVDAPALIYRGIDGDDPKVNRRRSLRAVTGACLLIRAELLRELGGFDEGYRNSFEDADLCLRAVERGWGVLYEPASVVVHLESQTPGRIDHDDANLARFRARWRDPLWADQDLRYFEDGVRAEPITLGGSPRLLFVRLSDAETPAWAGVAELQRLGPGAAASDVHRLLADASRWPASPGLSAWAERIRAFYGEREVAPRVELPPATATPPPARPLSRWLDDAVAAQLREI